MEKSVNNKKVLIMRAAKLTMLGHDVEHKRSIVKRIADMGIEPTMELFRAIDDFNNVKIEFDKIEREYLELKESMEANETN